MLQKINIGKLFLNWEQIKHLKIKNVSDDMFLSFIL